MQQNQDSNPVENQEQPEQKVEEVMAQKIAELENAVSEATTEYFPL